jgi:predicted transcriptional regulator
VNENILTIRIQSLEEVMRAVSAALTNNRPEATPGFSFPTYESMHQVLAPKRLDIIRAMAGQGPLGYREVARRIGREYKGVHSDITALIKAGVIERQKDGVVFPYDTIHFEFDIKAAAA